MCNISARRDRSTKQYCKLIFIGLENFNPVELTLIHNSRDWNWKKWCTKVSKKMRLVACVRYGELMSETYHTCTSVSLNWSIRSVCSSNSIIRRVVGLFSGLKSMQSMLISKQTRICSRTVSIADDVFNLFLQLSSTYEILKHYTNIGRRTT